MSIAEPDLRGSNVLDFGAGRFEIRDMRPRDMVEVLALHAKVFGRTFGEAQGQDWFAWKYARGAGTAVGVWEYSGGLIAHYAGFPRSLLWMGNALRAVQIGDVMVTPELRGILTRRGPFFEACSRYFGTHVGADRAYDLAFGFPNERHLRLGAALDLYLDAGPIYALQWVAQYQALPRWWRWSELDPSDPRTDRDVDAAWKAMQAATGDAVIGERTGRYVRWRFVDRPDRRYRLFRLRRLWSRRAAGIAVLRVEDGASLWLDWIGPPQAMPVAARALSAEAHRAATATLTAWASPAVVEALAGSGATTAGTSAWLAIAKCSVPESKAIADARWWLMGGDTDFL